MFALAAPEPKPEKPPTKLSARERAAQLFDPRKETATETGERRLTAEEVIPVAQLEDLEASGIELRFPSPVYGDVWLVAKKTGQPRRELTFRQMALLWQASVLFGAELSGTSIRWNDDPKGTPA